MRLRNLTEGFGAEADQISPDFREVWDAFFASQVLVFRSQRFSPSQFLRFAKQFGRPEPHVIDQFHHPEHADILILSNVQQDGRASWDVRTDHVVCGTGFEVDVDRHTVLDPAVTGRLERIVRAPRLTRHFESSMPGLYFIGAGSTFSFGPLFRFVAGAAYAAPALAGHLARTASRGKTAVVRLRSTGLATRGQGLVDEAMVAYHHH